MGYTRNLDQNIKIRFTSVLQTKAANKVLGKNEEHPIFNLDMTVTKDQCELLKQHYIRFEILE